MVMFERDFWSTLSTGGMLVLLEHDDAFCAVPNMFRRHAILAIDVDNNATRDVCFVENCYHEQYYPSVPVT